MLFFEYTFLFLFLPVALLGYYLLPGRLRHAWLLVASCVFYSVSSFFFLPVLLPPAGNLIGLPLERIPCLTGCGLGLNQN